MSATLATEHLVKLVKSRRPQEREALLQGVASLCESKPDMRATAPKALAVLDDIFIALVAEAERDIRARLAQQVAAAAWAPPGLVRMLAMDEIDIARPVIAASPILDDEVLVRLLVEATVEHQIEVARRPGLSAPVAEVILDQGLAPVLTSLAGNDTAQLGEAALQRLIDFAKQVSGIRTPLAHHPKLSAELAERLYQWVGQSLRETLAGRFRLDPVKLDAAIARSVREAHTGAKEAPEAAGPDEELMNRVLIEKLYAAGQLRPGYLIRTLKEGNLALFILGLAALGRFETDEVERALNSEKPELLALACATVGIDRSAFSDVLRMVRLLNAGRPSGGVEGARRAIGAFSPFNSEVAGEAFRTAVGRL